MDNLIYSAFRAAKSLFTPGMMAIFVQSILLTIAALTGFVFCSSLFFNWLAGALQDHMYASYLPWLGSIGATFLAWMLFPGIMPVIIGFFDDKIATKIEHSDYPASAVIPARFWPELAHDIRFALWAVTLNILVLPLYLLPVINLFLFYVLNGYLLGREFFTMVARRHLPLPDAKALYKRNGRTVIFAGIILTVLATIPIVNLFAPFWGIAVMVHLYHRLNGRPQVEILAPRII